MVFGAAEEYRRAGVIFSLSRLRERAGVRVCLVSSTRQKKEEDPLPTLSRKRERAKKVKPPLGERQASLL